MTDYVILPFFIVMAMIAIMGIKKPELDESKTNLDGFVHDGICTLMPVCAERCVCHDRCGPLCGTWRKLVHDGVVEPYGYKYILRDDLVIDCILANRKNKED